ncbi:MAG: zeta toxin family protein [Micavibrio sp.]|nr:zeta toxin family protein [Micavibrio sp.]
MNGNLKDLSPSFNDESATARPDAMTEAEYQRAFARMAHDYFSSKIPQENPVLVYITGLPGAGKSTFIDRQLQAAPELKNYIHINFDDLRIYHPRYADHVSADPVNAAARIDSAVERLIGWLTQEAASLKLNVLLDDAAMGGDITKAILQPFGDADYKIDATVIAVPSAIARQSVYLRFQENLAAACKGDSVIPRWVNTEEQDNAPAALIETAEALETGLATSLAIVSRNGRSLAADKPSNAVRAEMTRDLSDLEQAEYLAKSRHIATLMGPAKTAPATSFKKKSGI